MYSTMDLPFKQIIPSFLPFATEAGAWRRIQQLENENEQIRNLMLDCAQAFRQVIAEPREIYLTVQQVRSLTVYIRWRRKGVRGRQGYLLLDSEAGKAFLLRQPEAIRQCYRRFDQWALDLNLAHSLRLNEIRRLKTYLQHTARRNEITE
ncbi:hypothetical protein [Methylotuvimicrobium sp. KM1]|uniref:hypothetical protein n=1 Tax=Methylotuvimicrobium sp. KM1 TaxID=3377707 RepID=UPI00384D2717